MKKSICTLALCILITTVYKAQTPPYNGLEEMHIFNYSEFTMGGHVTGSRPGLCYPTLDGHFGDNIYPAGDPLGRDYVMYNKYYNTNTATVPIYTWYFKGNAAASPVPLTPGIIPINNSAGIYTTLTVFSGMIVEYWDNISIHNNFAVNTVNTAGGDCESYPLNFSDGIIDVESFYIGNNYYVIIA